MAVLADAQSIYLGGESLKAIYLGGEKVWPPDIPATITGLVGWYDASQLDLADGAAITAWPDLSGQGLHLSSGSVPTFRTGGPNGLPVARFNGQWDYLYAASSRPYRHFFVVAMYRLASFKSYDGLIGGVNWLVLTGNGGGTTWYPYEESSTSYHFNGVEHPNNWPGPLNGQFAVMSVLRHPQHGPWADVLQVGQDRTIIGRNWDGDVAEVIAYDRVLSTAERQRVEDYLRDKWLTVAYGPPESLYTSYMPVSQPSDPNTFSVGNQFTVLADGRITAIRYYAVTLLPSRHVALWSLAGAKLAEGHSANEVSGWNVVPITPVEVTAGQTFRTAYAYPGSAAAGIFPFTMDAPTPGPHLRWDGGAYATPAPTGRSEAFPDNVITPNNYFGDVIYEAEL